MLRERERTGREKEGERQIQGGLLERAVCGGQCFQREREKIQKGHCSSRPLRPSQSLAQILELVRLLMEPFLGSQILILVFYQLLFFLFFQSNSFTTISISNGSTTTPNGISKAREDVTCLVSFAFINLIGALLNPNFVEKYLHLNGCIMQ